MVVFAFVLSSALAGLGGILIAPITFAWAYMGTMPGIKAFAAAIFGGLDNPIGILIGGLVIGVLEQLLGMVNSNLKEGITFFFILIVLAIRPTGLMGAGRSPRSDMQLPIFAFSGPKDWVLVALAALILALLPVVFDDPFFILVMQSLAYLFIVTLGLDILVGWTGQISLGHAGALCGRRLHHRARLDAARLAVLAERPARRRSRRAVRRRACGPLAARQGPLPRHGDDRVRLHGRGDEQPLEPYRRADGDHVDPAADAS